MKRIAVVGLGQIGGSIVRTLRSKHKKYFITGIDASPKRLRLLDPFLDRTSKKWSESSDADFTIICLHYGLTAEFLRQADPKRLLIDTCSGKAKLLQLANKRKLRFIGGHPMAGNEFEGEKGWRKDLFEHAPFFLCPPKQFLPQDLKIVRIFAQDLGAVPLIVDAKQHDDLLSITSHFPAILAGLLNKMGQKAPAHFKGPGFRSMTRLANTSPELLKTFLESNGQNVMRSAKQMRRLLDQWIRSAL